LPAILWAFLAMKLDIIQLYLLCNPINLFLRGVQEHPHKFNLIPESPDNVPSGDGIYIALTGWIKN
ncbi:MAG: hypothetical protein QW358_00680, partial [Candidatus Hadarchaeum sp.]